MTPSLQPRLCLAIIIVGALASFACEDGSSGGSPTDARRDADASDAAVDRPGDLGGSDRPADLSGADVPMGSEVGSGETTGGDVGVDTAPCRMCGGGCVDLRTDPNHCGGCGIACKTDDPNATPACTVSNCDYPCKAGHHRCDTTCVPDNAPATCGNRCQPCPDAPANAVASCEAGKCSYTCNPGFHRCPGIDGCVSNNSVATCGTSCTPCAQPANGTATCDGTQCGVESCPTGEHKCGGVCVKNEALGTCGNRCAPCPEVANATATCNGTDCGFVCNTGYHRCGSKCVADNDATACGSSCTACPAGPSGTTAVCRSGACGVACSAGGSPCGPPPSNGTTACEAGACSFTCKAGFCKQGNSCVAATSIDACGATCAKCTARASYTAACESGACVETCPSGLCGAAKLTITPESKTMSGLNGTVVKETFTVKNGGAEASGAITAVLKNAVETDINGGGGEFSLDEAGGTCTATPGTTLAAGATCTVVVAFRPVRAINRTATLTVTAAAGSMATAMLSGSGQTAAKIGAAEMTVDFGAVDPGAPAMHVKKVPLMNAGGLTAAAVEGLTATASTTTPNTTATFIATLVNCPARLSVVVDTCEVSIEYRPARGVVVGKVVISSSNGGSVEIVTKGDGTKPDLVVNTTGTGNGTSAVDIGAHTFGVAHLFSLTVTNAGPGSSFMLDSNLDPPTNGLPATFEVRGDTCRFNRLAPGASCKVDLAFTPSMTAPNTATYRVGEPTSSPPMYRVVTITGTGK